MKSNAMTLEELKALDKEMLIPAEVAPILGVGQYSINLQVKEDKKSGKNSFCFPTMLVGTRVLIPRRAFIKALEGLAENGGNVYAQK